MKRQYLLTVKYIAESDGKEHELLFLYEKYPDLPNNAANDLLAEHLDEAFVLTDYEVKELERHLIDTRQQPVELVLWEDVRKAMKYPHDDTNNGYTYGIYLLSSHNLHTAEVLEVQWFKTQDARTRFIKQNNLKVLNETT